MEAFLKHASQAYAVDYFGVVIVLALLECVVPRRASTDALKLRWFGNFAVTILDMIVVRVAFPMAAVAWAVFCSERGWGLFNQWAGPTWLEFGLTILALDAVAYFQHYLLHYYPVLWRLHRLHHTDLEVDFTTGVRFHPLEAVFTTAVVLVTIVALGAHPVATLVWQLMTVVVSLAEHANVHIPSSCDRVIRLFLVTPDMHRIHHSQDVRESCSNYSNMFPLWDRLFGTYLDQPAAGHDGVTFGVAEFVARKHITLPWMLAQPFLCSQTSSERQPAARGDVACEESHSV
jgi:sterol desaturase/sphingolipid hydroxylase (fatty acid hydroxylase superfamily)